MKRTIVRVELDAELSGEELGDALRVVADDIKDTDEREGAVTSGACTYADVCCAWAWTVEVVDELVRP